MDGVLFNYGRAADYCDPIKVHTLAVQDEQVSRQARQVLGPVT